MIPRAKKSSADGVRNDALIIRLAAPPVEGAANNALIAFLSETLSIPRRNIRIVSGERSRNKRVVIALRAADDVLRLLTGDSLD